MSPIQRLVPPELPTALATHSHIDLPGYDLWFHNVHNVHIVPIQLDIPKFEEALSKVLQLYPHAAGQLRWSNGRWSIELTNTAVPVDIDYKLGMSCDLFLNSDWVIQDDLSPFLSRQPIGANLVNGGAPLLRLKLTFFDNETSLGVSWHHTLGDAIFLSRFMHTLSQFYQSLPSKYAAPTFKKHHFPTPSPSISAAFWPRMPHLHDPCLISELEEKFIGACKNTENLRWRFDIHDLDQLRSTLSSIGEEKIYLSKQDCLTAYLVAVLNHTRSVAVQKVTVTSSFRNIGASFIVEEAATNPLQNVPATVPTDIVGVAMAIRHAITQCREPDYIYNWVTVASNHMLESANVGRSYFFAPHDDVVTVNSNTVIDWCSAHFGCPDGSRFYTIGFYELNVRCFRSNPAKGDDGTWQVRQSVDISIGIPTKLKPEFHETLCCGIPHILGKERIQP